MATDRTTMPQNGGERKVSPFQSGFGKRTQEVNFPGIYSEIVGGLKAEGQSLQRGVPYDPSHGFKPYGTLPDRGMAVLVASQWI